MKDKTMWYWEYQLKVFDIDSKEEIRSGIVSANTFTEAMEEIEDYYKDEIIEVQMLKPIVDNVFDFKYVMEDPSINFDFTITRKL